MVKNVETGETLAPAPGLRLAENPEVALAISYASAMTRGAMAALIELDDTLAAVLRTAGDEPMLVQMRLTWWRDRLLALDSGEAPAVPVLQQVSRELVAHGVSGTMLSGMVAGWEVLLDEPEMGEGALTRFAEARGGTLFTAAAQRLGLGDDLPIGVGGQGWALADLARHVTDRALSERARGLAVPLLAGALRAKWPGEGRALSALALRARMDMRVPVERPVPYGAPSRVMRMGWHRMTGR